jgi:antirestriction protein ArdC
LASGVEIWLFLITFNFQPFFFFCFLYFCIKLDSKHKAYCRREKIMTTHKNANLGAGIDEALDGIVLKMNEITATGSHPLTHSFAGNIIGGYLRDNKAHFSSRNSMFMKIYSKWLSTVKGHGNKVSNVFLTLSQAKAAGGYYSNKNGVPIEPGDNMGCPSFFPLSFNVEMEKLSIIQKFRLKVKGFEDVTEEDLRNARVKGEPESINGMSYNPDRDTVSQIVPGKFREYTVFNAAEFAGLPADMMIIPSINEVPLNESHKALVELIADNGVDVDLLKQSAHLGKYDAVNDKLLIRDPIEFGIDSSNIEDKDKQAILEYTSIQAREFIKATGGFKRDNRLHSAMDNDDNNFEDIIAESGAVMLTSALGFENVELDTSAQNIMSYIGDAESSAAALWSIAGKCSKVLGCLENNNEHLSNLINKGTVVSKAMVWYARATTKNSEGAIDKLALMGGLKGKNKGIPTLSMFAKKLAQHDENTPLAAIQSLPGEETESFHKKIQIGLVEAVKFIKEEVPEIQAEMKAEFSEVPQVIPAVPTSAPSMS